MDYCGIEPRRPRDNPTANCLSQSIAPTEEKKQTVRNIMLFRNVPARVCYIVGFGLRRVKSCALSPHIVKGTTGVDSLGTHLQVDCLATHLQVNNNYYCCDLNWCCIVQPCLLLFQGSMKVFWQVALPGEDRIYLRSGTTIRVATLKVPHSTFLMHSCQHIFRNWRER
jgi:hypothetical protein